MCSLCVSLTSPATSSSIFGFFSDNCHGFLKNLRDAGVWRHLDSTTHPAGSRLQMVDIHISCITDTQGNDGFCPLNKEWESTELDEMLQAVDDGFARKAFCSSILLGPNLSSGTPPAFE
jgi:hypothetical protein